MNTRKGYGVPADDLDYMAGAAREDLLRLKDARIFLTGCTGFLGKWIIEGLLYGNETLGLGLELAVLTRSKAKVFREMPHWAEHSDLKLVEGDVLSLPREVTGTMTHVIHGANLCNDGKEDWALRHMETALSGTRNVLELARASGCKTVLLLSSGAVYGIRQGRQKPPYKEEEQCAADYLDEPNVYAHCKYMGEMYAAAFGQKYGIRIPVARLFTFAGKYMPMNRRNAFASFLDDARNGRDIVIEGDGKAVRSYMHASDMVVYVISVLNKGDSSKVYNIGAMESVSMNKLAEIVKERINNKSNIIILNKSNFGNGTYKYIPDAENIKQISKHNYFSKITNKFMVD
jgi:dTDP-glucose 4,6-dehydratase